MDRKSSFPPVVDQRTQLLILGSLPGERSLAAHRYYAHPQNQFWRLVGRAIARDLVPLSYEARLAALRHARIGLWDVVASATRTGSTDATIREHEINDLRALAATLPKLRAIAFNGAKAASLGAPLVAAFDLPILRLPSSSPLHTIGAAAKQPAWDAIATFLSD